MPFVPTRHQTVRLLIALSVGHVLLISAQVQTRSGLPVIEEVAFQTFAWIHRTAGATAGGLGAVWSGWIALHDVEQENAELRLRLAELEGRVMGLEAIARSAQELEEALQLQARTVPPTLAARVIAGNPTPGILTVLIDKGRADGVTRDMAVVAVDGVVGRVLGEPAARQARVQLLVGASAAAAAMLERSGAGGLATGQGATVGDIWMRLEYVPNLVDVQPGERVFTSGRDGIYPPGFPIGTVEDVRPGSDFRDIRIRPAVDISGLNVVLVVLERPAGSEGSLR